MRKRKDKTGKTEFTAAEKALLYGLSKKIAKKRNCSSMYVRHIINGKRQTNSVLAKAIVRDLRVLLKVLRTEE